MANQTVKDAMSVKGTNPQYLVEKIIRSVDCCITLVHNTHSAIMYQIPNLRLQVLEGKLLCPHG